jgi:hypothetical protein
MADRHGRNRRELGRAAMIEGVDLDAEQRADPLRRIHRHRSSYNRGHEAVEHRQIRGGGAGSALQP